MKDKTSNFTYKRVMLLDDNEMDNFINEKIIKAVKLSENVFINTSPLSAIEFFKNLIKIGPQSAELYPQLILVDVNMPLMDGFQFINHLQRLPIAFKPKLAILTSSMNKEDEYKAVAISKDIVFLKKPLTEEMLHSL